MAARFIIDEDGNKVSVILPVKEYEKLVEAREELQDIKLYDAVKAKNEPLVSLSDYRKKRLGK